MSDALFSEGTYAVVEVMGHQTFAGKISEHVLGGSAFIRVDVAEIPEETQTTDDWRGKRQLTIPALPGFTKLIGAGSIYAITPCSEDVARKVSKEKRAAPVAIAEFTPAITSKLIEAAPDSRPSARDSYGEDDDVDLEPIF